MDDRAGGAVALLTALERAGNAFRRYGYRLFLAHPSVRWNFGGRVGHAVSPCASVGVSFDLRDEQLRQVSLGVDVWVRDGHFEVSASGTVDDPLPAPGAAGNQRFLRDLPEVCTTDLDECIAALDRYTAELCAYVTVLDELGVPRS